MRQVQQQIALAPTNTPAAVLLLLLRRTRHCDPSGACSAVLHINRTSLFVVLHASQHAAVMVHQYVVCMCCLQDGLDAPPEEWPASGALEDDEDLPIEALMDDDDEDEDLSLAALLRRQMLAQQGEDHSANSSKVGSATSQPTPTASSLQLQPVFICCCFCLIINRTLAYVALALADAVLPGWASWLLLSCRQHSSMLQLPSLQLLLQTGSAARTQQCIRSISSR
jgi:hypothetical protein